MDVIRSEKGSHVSTSVVRVGTFESPISTPVILSSNNSGLRYLRDGSHQIVPN